MGGEQTVAPTDSGVFPRASAHAAASTMAITTGSPASAAPVPPATTAPRDAVDPRTWALCIRAVDAVVSGACLFIAALSVIGPLHDLKMRLSDVVLAYVMFITFCGVVGGVGLITSLWIEYSERPAHYARIMHELSRSGIVDMLRRSAIMHAAWIGACIVAAAQSDHVFAAQIARYAMVAGGLGMFARYVEELGNWRDFLPPMPAAPAASAAAHAD